MAVLDSSIVNVALPDISGTLGVTIEEITWVVTAYILAQVIVMPITGLLSARFGRKRFYTASVILFTASSMACGSAHGLGSMVLFRVLQGFGGGVLLTVSQAILRESFPPEEQGLAMGLYGLGAVLAPAFGPTLGGWLTDQYSWPWIFYINVPVGVVNLILVSRFIEYPSYLVREKVYIDWPGLGLLVWRELTTDRPAVNLRILSNISFASATALGGVLGLGLTASLFLLPVFLQNLLGFNAMQSGFTLMPRSLAMAVLMPVAGRFYNRLGPRILVGSGLLIAGAAFYSMSKLTTSVGYWDLFWPQLWQGVGFSLIFVALSTAALSTIARPNMTAATGLYNVVRQVMGSVGIAIAATTLTTTTARYHAILSEDAGASVAGHQWLDALTKGMMAKGADAFTAAAQAMRVLDGLITRQAAVLAYNHVFVLVSSLFFIGFPLVFLLRGGSPDAEAEIALD